MSITLSLLGALLLLFPGLTALAIWNLLASRQTAHRPELPLTAVSALFIAVGVSLLAHLIAYGLLNLVSQAAVELGALTGQTLGKVVDPFGVAAKLMGLPGAAPTRADMLAFGLMILAEATWVAAVISSRGLDIALGSADIRGLGWAHRHYLEPLRNGYTPIAFVLTSAIDKGYGVGFEGPIDDLRLGDNRELKMLSLGQPERFLYELRPRVEALADGEKAAAEILPDLMFHDSKFVGGVINIEVATIRNLVIHNYPTEAIAQVAGEGGQT